MDKRIKILIIAGARPNFIKIAPLFEEFKKCGRVKTVLVHTGQHYDCGMSQVFFSDFCIPKPDYNLGVGPGTHAQQTAKIMEKLEPVAAKEKPDLVIVVGDVNSTLAGALVAAKLVIPLAHVEAGLRSYDRSMPEEVNRILVDHVSDLLFCPTETAVGNLAREGIEKGVFNVGDVMYDAFLKNIETARAKSRILEKLNLRPKEYLLLTIHRSGNADNPAVLKKILGAVRKSGRKIVFPIHPRTKKRLIDFKMKTDDIASPKGGQKLTIIEPVDYLDMIWLEKNAAKIITDSGGVQKEAFWFKVPCVTLRNETEWVETVANGWNKLVGSDENRILASINQFEPDSKQKKIFGSGDAAKKIIHLILKNSAGKLSR